MAFKSLKGINEKEIISGYRAKFIHSDNMTFAYWDVGKGAALPENSHPHEQVANVLERRFEIFIDKEKRILEPGDVALIPSNAKHCGKALTRCRILDVFYPVREDYR
jgi:quercetin dioxygenase-like cupin family protein